MNYICTRCAADACGTLFLFFLWKQFFSFGCQISQEALFQQQPSSFIFYFPHPYIHEHALLCLFPSNGRRSRREVGLTGRTFRERSIEFSVSRKLLAAKRGSKKRGKVSLICFLFDIQVHISQPCTKECRNKMRKSLALTLLL
jgi:hypothetical protein